MTTRHLIDPEVLPMLDVLPGFDFNAETLPAIRAGFGAQFEAMNAPPLMPVRKTIAAPDGEIDIYWYDPAPGTRNRAALLHIHGGGMIIGSAAAMQGAPAAMALALGIPVASVEYRLAPETPFPGPQSDCYAALEWLAASAVELGIDAARIGVIGESAGGGLAAALAHMARDKGGPALAAQILIYPMLDHRTGSAACPYANRTTGEFVWTRASNQFGWGSLRGGYGADDARKGWFSPSLAADLSGLPPTWIGIGALDLFLDEDLDYARRLADAGVPVELHCYPGAIHGFNMATEARIARAFDRDMMAAIAALLRLEPAA